MLFHKKKARKTIKSRNICIVMFCKNSLQNNSTCETNMLIRLIAFSLAQTSSIPLGRMLCLRKVSRKRLSWCMSEN